MRILPVPVIAACFCACHVGAKHHGEHTPKPPSLRCEVPLDPGLASECETILTPLLDAQDRACGSCPQCRKCWWQALEEEGVRRKDVHVLAVKRGSSFGMRHLILGATSPTNQYLVRVAYDPTDPNDDGDLLVCYDGGQTALLKRRSPMPVVDVSLVTDELCWYQYARGLAICAAEWSKFSRDPVEVFARTVKYCTEAPGPCCHFD